MDKWKLIEVKDIEWQQDKSGFYCIINWIDDNTIRLDILTTVDQPAISFQGTAKAIRKHVMRYAEEHGWNISLEHAAYIGYELAIAELLGDNYIQN